MGLGDRGGDGGVAVAPREQPASGLDEAGGQQDDAHDGAGEHDQARGHAGAPDERDAGDEQAGDRHEDDAGGREGGMAGGGVGAAGRFERRVARAQLVLLAGGEQQRVVDAGAQAEHAGEGRGEAGDVGEGRGPHEGAEAQADAGERGAERVARGAEVAQNGDQQEDGDGESDQLADREAADGRLVDDLARHGDVDAGPLERRGGGFQALERRCVEILRRLVVVDGGERRPAVFGDTDLVDGAHMGLRLDPGDRRGDVAALEVGR